MKATEALILWTLNTDKFDGKPEQGRVEVTDKEETLEQEALISSVGCCDLEWNQADDQGRMDLMQKHYSQMIHRDNIDPDALDEALSVVDEFRGHKFDRNEPDWEEGE